MTLRIKKQFFNQIKSGEKTAEYRNGTGYYFKIFAKNPEAITLHYQTKEKITIKIKSIEIVPNIFKKENRPSYLSTDLIFKISLGDTECI